LLLCELACRARKRVANELGSRTFVDRRGDPRNIARSAQTARAAEATTSGNSSLGGGRRRCARKPWRHSFADHANPIAPADASHSRFLIDPLPDNKARSPFISITLHAPRKSQRSRSHSAALPELRRPNIFQASAGCIVARAPQAVSKKDRRSFDTGKNFALFACPVRFTRLMSVWTDPAPHERALAARSPDLWPIQKASSGGPHHSRRKSGRCCFPATGNSAQATENMGLLQR
jgi:hypothetical protein